MYVDTTHPLCVDLGDVCETLGQDVAGHLVAKLVPELGGLSSRPHDRGAGVCDGARHDAADRGRQLVDVRDGRGVDELVGHLLLRDDDGAVLAAHSHRRDVGCRDGLEGIFLRACESGTGAGEACMLRTDLVETTLVGEDGDVSVVACAACSTPESARSRLPCN